MKSNSVLIFDFHFENFSNFDLLILNNKVSTMKNDLTKKNCDLKIETLIIIFETKIDFDFEIKIDFFDKFEKI